VVACSKAVQTLLCEPCTRPVDVAIELGGEDAKILRYNGSVLDAQMNSTCAAGTGAFIDQMASLLETDAAGLNALAENHKNVYTIAPRCGVFAKADVQPMLSEGVARADIAMSIFNAVVVQTISGLACGKQISGKVAFLGGPLHFLSCLRQCFIDTLKLQPEDVVSPPYAHAIVCRGAAMHGAATCQPMPFSFLMKRFKRAFGPTSVAAQFSTVSRLPPLFSSPEELSAFRKRHAMNKVAKADIGSATGPLFLGIDSGSTTLKLALIDSEGKLLYSHYGIHQGGNLRNAVDSLVTLRAALSTVPGAYIAACAVTGYGEHLLKSAVRADFGLVETTAHLRAARFFQPDTDLLLDIGGQDMKCIKIGPDGAISEIFLNEACSSGCGSFIQTLASSLNIPLPEFVEKGLRSTAPIDLGSKCTVFMNSRIKQAQRDGASIEDMSAGIAMSIVKNALFKVMRLTSTEDVGSHIVVQGGTFLNDAVLRSLETLLHTEVVRPDIAGLMGAFGAALEARNRCETISRHSTLLSLGELKALQWESTNRRCGKCINNCLLNIHTFQLDGTSAQHISGNRCVQGLGESERESFEKTRAPNVLEWQRKRVFAHKSLSAGATKRGTIGIPRVLQFYEYFPLWEAVFRALGFRVFLSMESSDKVFAKGMSTIPVEVACMPVKLVHGHITDLVERLHVSYVFLPCVPLSIREDTDSNFQYTYGSKPVFYECPLIAGYHDVVNNNMEAFKRPGCTLLHPAIPIFDQVQAATKFFEYMAPLFPGLTRKEVDAAMQAGYAAQEQYRQELRHQAKLALEFMKTHNRPGAVVAGRPYHLDPFVGSSIVSNLLTTAGYTVLTSDSVAHLGRGMYEPERFFNMQANDSRIINAAKFAARREDILFIHLVSFGCSISAETDDEVKFILHRHRRPHCSIKLDQNTNSGAIRVRIRSLQENLPASNRALATLPATILPPIPIKASACSKTRTMLFLNFSPEHTDLYAAAFNQSGYNLVQMPDYPEDKRDELGLRYAHPDMCYGGPIIVGEVLTALQSGKFNPDETDFMWIHMGGACSAVRISYRVRDALDRAGYKNSRVISVDCSGSVNPGFSVPQTVRINMSLVLGDCLTMVLRRVRPYELVPGSANALHATWRQRVLSFIKTGNPLMFSSLVQQLVRDFDNLPLRTEEHDKPRVGLVGLMCKADPIKYEWLNKFLEEDEGCEVCPYFFTDYSEASGGNNLANHRLLAPDRGKWTGGKAALKIVQLFKIPMITALAKSKRFTRACSYEELEQLASKFISPLHTAGEGWTIVGQMLRHLENGVNNLVITVPFGCLPIHITGKGMLKKIREVYPQANMCVIDYDPSASFVNQLNRIKLMLGCVKDKNNSGELNRICQPNDIEDCTPTHTPSGCTMCPESSQCKVVATAKATSTTTTINAESCHAEALTTTHTLGVQQPKIVSAMY